MLGSLRQKSLHGCTLKFRDHELTGSVFPLFNDSGETKALMITAESDGDILIVDFAKNLFAGRSLLPRVWPQRLNLHRAELRDSDLDAASGIADLWHFDPWWELRDDRYSGHSLVPTLKATNLVAYDESITAVHFSTTLHSVTYIGFGKVEDFKLKRFRPKLLDTAKAERKVAAASRDNAPRHASDAASSSRPTGWRLRPFW